MSAPSDADYERLLAFRTELRRFVQWSEQAAREAQLTPALHQLLLAVRGDRSEGGATVGSVAAALLVRHHTAVELAQRAERQGLIERRRDDADHRRVHLSLTAAGARRLDALSAAHLERIGALARRLTVLGAGAGQ
ncbi:MAG: MarR family transcriptional regulator [Solirubrobacteraceae bacterium]